jgi:hypothetical protein
MKFQKNFKSKIIAKQVPQFESLVRRLLKKQRMMPQTNNQIAFWSKKKQEFANEVIDKTNNDVQNEMNLEVEKTRKV